MAQVSYGTITITDTNDIERIYVVYAKSTSNTNVPSAAASSWTESIGSAPGTGDFIWQRTVTEMSGTLEKSYGNPVCVTGPEGDTGVGVSSIVPYYYLSTSNSSVTGGSWGTAPQSYPSTGTKYYWTKNLVTYTDGTTSESTPIYDDALTSSVKNSRDANNKANQVETNLNNYITTNNANIAAFNTRTKYFWTNLDGESHPIGTYAASGIDGVEFAYNNQSTYGYNTRYSNGIELRYNAINLGKLTGTSLIFYKPSLSSQGAKAMELDSNALTFYDGSAASGGNVQAQFGSSGAIQSGDYAINAITDKFSTYGTKIDLVHGEIYSPYFRLSQGSVSGGPVAGIYMSGTFESTGAIIGHQKTSNSDTNAYWKIGYMTDTNQDRLTYQRADSNGFIELAPSATFILQKNKIHTGWFGSNGYLIYPQLSSKYYDFGMNLPTSLSDKFLYIRYNSGTDLSTIYQNDSGWTYPFYIDAEGKVHAQNFYIGDSTTPIGGGAGTIAEKLMSGAGSATQPVYFRSDSGHVGEVATTTYALNAAGAKGVDTSMPTTATDNNVPTTKLMKTFVEGKGYITGYTETDPTVPSWAKASSKPSYALSEITSADDIKAIEALTGTTGLLRKTATNTWSLDTNTYLTSYTETDPIFVASVAHGITSSDITNWNGKTSNVGTVTKVSTGVGLIGGDITGSGTIKANLRSETKLTNDSAAATETSGRVYPVVLDKSGYLAVNVPWTNVNSNYLTSSSTLNWNNVTTNRPTTLSGYGITDAKIANGVVTLGSNTISKMPNPNALTIKVYNANTATAQGSTYSPTEVSYDGSASGKTASVAGTNAITNISAGAASGGTSTFTVVKADGSSSTFNVNISGAVVSGATILTDSDGNGLSVAGPVYFDTGVPKSMKPSTSSGLYLKDDGTWGTPGGTYSLPLAANGTRGGIQIGFTTSAANRNYAVALSSEKAYVNVPWTDRYVNSAGFADDTTNSSSSPVKMTLTRAGSDTNTVTANIPKVSSSSAGVVPKGASVSSQSQSTKFLREDGTWAAPSYTTNTNTATAADNILDGSNSGTQITYAPYTSRQSGLSLYTGTTAPNGTTRLNLNGYLYATKLYSGGTEVLTSHQDLSNYKIKQTAISAPTATTNKWVNTLAQNANGEITVTYTSLDTSGTWSGNATTATTATKLGSTTVGGTGTPIYLDSGSPKAITSAISVSLGGTGATTLTSGAALIGNGTGAVGTRSITNQTSGAVTASTNLVTANSLVAHTNSVVGNYVAKSGDTMTGTLTTPELITTKLTAKDVNVTHLLTAEGIQTKNWTAVNMATIDGSFYIVPTVTAATASVKYTTNGTLEFTATGTSTFATNSLFINGDATNWTVNSLIMITGLIHIGSEDISIGTLKGKLTAVNPTNKTLTLGGTITSSTGTNTPDILGLLTAGTTYTCKDIKVSIYSYYNNSHENLLGIMMTTAGTKNRTYIDIYDGTHQTNAATDYYDSNTTYTEPVVRIGNLRGLPVMANGDAPTGWGIYTTNGFFRGIISAESGHIGKTSASKIVISDNASNAAIYSGSHSTLASTNAGFYIGVDGISIGSKFKYIGGSTNTLTVDSISATNFSFNSGSISGNVTIGTGGSSITNSLAAKASSDAEYSVEISTGAIDFTANNGNGSYPMTANIYKLGIKQTSGNYTFKWYKDSDTTAVYTSTGYTSSYTATSSGVYTVTIE